MCFRCPNARNGSQLSSGFRNVVSDILAVFKAKNDVDTQHSPHKISGPLGARKENRHKLSVSQLTWNAAKCCFHLADRDSLM